MTHHEYKDEIDFRDLVKHPWKLLGYAYVYIFAIIVGLGLIYVFNLTDIGKNAVPSRVLADSTAFVKDIPSQAPAIIPPVDVKVVSKSTDSLIALGRTVFKANCVSCHGDEGNGDGAGGAALNPKPRNFHSASGWTNGPKVSQIYRTLEEGIVKNGMASYNYLPAKDRFALAHLIRTWVPNPPMDTDAEIMGLETAYQLSKGQVRAAQIPVARATTIVEKETEAYATAVASAVSALEQSNERGAVVLRSVAANEVRVLTALTTNGYRFGSVDDLVRAVSVDPVRLGFKAAASRLSTDDWSAIHQYLSKSASRKG